MTKLTIENKYDIGDAVFHAGSYGYRCVRKVTIVNLVIEKNRFKYLCEFEDKIRGWSLEENLRYKEDTNENR